MKRGRPVSSSQSPKLIDAAQTRIKISLSEGDGVATSSSFKTSGGPYTCRTAAFTAIPLAIGPEIYARFWFSFPVSDIVQWFVTAAEPLCRRLEGAKRPEHKPQVKRRRPHSCEAFNGQLWSHEIGARVFRFCEEQRTRFQVLQTASPRLSALRNSLRKSSRSQNAQIAEPIPGNPQRATVVEYDALLSAQDFLRFRLRRLPFRDSSWSSDLRPVFPMKLSLVSHRVPLSKDDHQEFLQPARNSDGLYRHYHLEAASR